jgi:hypothetical protein
MYDKTKYLVIVKNVSVGVSQSAPVTENIEAHHVRFTENGGLIFERDTESSGRELVAAFASGNWCKVTVV